MMRRLEKAGLALFILFTALLPPIDSKIEGSIIVLIFMLMGWVLFMLGGKDEVE